MSSIGKATAGAVGVAVTLVIGLIVSVIAAAVVVFIHFMAGPETLSTCEDLTQSIDSSESTSLTVKGKQMSAEQFMNATTIVGEAIDNDLPTRAGEVGIMTATTESGLLNLSYGYPGSTSLGLFQQIEAWGPREARMNPAKAAEMFYLGGKGGQPGLTDIAEWQTLPRGEAAQAVQRSAYPDAYSENEDEAIKTVQTILDVAVIVPAVRTCEEDFEGPLEPFVQAALSRLDSSSALYGAKLISEAAEDAGFTLPDSFEQLAKFVGSEDDGVTGKFISSTDFMSGAEELTRGDVVLTARGGGNSRADAENAGVFVSPSSSVNGMRFATYNVLGASHTPASGPQSWNNRIEKSAKLIKDNGFAAVGLQELEPRQRTRLLELLGSDWGIYPQQATYGNSPLVDSVNSIIWDKTQLEAIEFGDLDMPRYFYGNRKQIPLVKFQQVETGDQFYMYNEHDPAHPENADQRLENAKERADQLDQLIETEGLPVIGPGDYNSSFDVRSQGNTTVGGLRQNLTWCVLTRSGNMMNAYDASQSPPRLGECPVATSREPGLGPVDHIYVSKDVTVSGYTMIEGRDKTGSDHPVIYIDTGTANQTASGLGRFVGVGDDSIVKLLTLRESEFVGVIRLNISDVLVQSGDWVFPLAKGTYNISSPYGPRNLNGDDFHNGADYGTNGVEAPLVAMHRGTVLRAQYDDAWGNYLMVETNIPVEGVPGATYKYMYAHLSRYELGLTLGQKLEAGDPVGNVGDTGNSFGEHLHLNICTSLDCLNGDPEGTVNPADFLRSVRITP